MDDLLSEINRKRAHVESKPGLLVNGKFFKRSALEEKEKEEYLSKYQAYKQSQSSSAQSAVENIDQLAEKTSEKIAISSNEIILRLRKRSQPIKLFGETDLMTYQRLRKLELTDPDLLDNGRKNDMQILMEKMEHESHSNLAKDAGSQDAHDVKVKPSGINFEELAEKGLKLAQIDYHYDMNVILKFCQLMLQLWGQDLNGRTTAVKKSQQGRLEAARYLQTVDYMRPMMRQLKSNSMEEDILDSLASVVYWTLKKEYIKASDSYLQMAIGNAPWPIGVTMHGIHARPGKDKLATKSIAHVLNDEEQRKYIQAFKRLITFCQKIYSTDPSRSVEFNA
ncbi:pre-mRNA-splicing factor 18-like [Symsagittifera roscoffensis]|uniref:pre-mRNA-splicing factor 18-like n=1 Tax=Symsagittifera roscoffensis TaxID=84072 RepID=UPI00307B35C8